MASDIHPSAVVDPAARLADGVSIGPFCVVGAGVSLGPDVKLLSHVVIEGDTTIGARTVIYPFASIGHIPQDKKFQGEKSRLEIGSDNTIREYVTMNPGTEGGGLVTRIGNHGLFLAGCHIAHDCIVGDHVILVNYATLAGHVVVGDYAIVGGLSGVHQFVRIGAHAMIGGMTGVDQDVIPYGLVVAERGHLAGLNLVGLKRRGFDREQIHDLRNAVRSLFAAEGNMAARVEELSQTAPEKSLVADLVEFLTGASDRKILKPKQPDGL